jgi:hypothetical protein
MEMQHQVAFFRLEGGAQAQRSASRNHGSQGRDSLESYIDAAVA